MIQYMHMEQISLTQDQLRILLSLISQVSVKLADFRVLDPIAKMIEEKIVLVPEEIKPTK